MTTSTTRQLRREDEPLLRGRGRYTADLREPRQAAAVFLRAPMASAEIRRVDTTAAQRAPGVLAVLTATDLAGTGSLAGPLPVPGRGGSKLIAPRWPALAEGRVLHAGQPVAVVVAETHAQAQDAVELIEVDYNETPAVVDARSAIEPDAPQVWPEAPGNIALDFTWPLAKDSTNADEVARIIAGAPLVARLSVSNQRLAAATMEPRAVTGWYDAKTGEYTLRTGTQSVWLMANQLAGLFGVKPEQMRVLTDDVGGAFGMKSGAYPEYVAVLVAAKRLGRPVGWASSRAEAFLSDNQARDEVMEGELALDKDGKFLALRVRSVADMGAFANGAGPLTATINMVRCFPSVYRIPRIVCDVLCVLTNTVQLGPYRGAGRPEANYLMERLVEEAARVSGIDPVTLRRRNLVTPAELPYKGAMGTVYDSGDFPAVFDKALELADLKGFPARKKQSESRGRLRGIGLSCFLEHSGAIPPEGASLSFPGDGTVVVGLGAQSTGQGHLTVFAGVAAEKLGIDRAKVVVREGDTRLGVEGHGSFASRSAAAAGSAIFYTAEAVIEKGKKVAAQMLEAAEADIGYRGGFFEIAGTDRRVALFDVARKAQELKSKGEIAESLDTNKVSQTPQHFPNGCHVAEVEIDPETGALDMVAYSGADDSGRILNAMIVEGQVHGGVAQGLGQALLENALYDKSGQLLAGSFMDYAMPRATDMPPRFADALLEFPCKTNPIGVKGAGEAGTTGALAAIMNAIADAIPGEAGHGLQMPATPQKIWRACRAARGGGRA
ncbi:MAG: xanthine dehydrogenase family protein molybdopterin-binding subunit [Alphaproteobacteria bacterium]|nr:xanthine dehydrogenase family protein molybdopterin-binding subunit [Alphaproteobacteria bacterium]